MPENDKLKFSQLDEITRAQMAGSDYAVGYKANGDNKKWTFENQADFLLNDSDAGQEFQETFVKVQDTEPSDENNRIWVKETPDAEVEVPTYDELEAVVDDVEALKSAINADRYDDIFAESVYESGSMSAYNGTNISYTTRIRTKSYLPKNVCFIKPKDGYKVSLYVWNASGTYQGVWNGSSLVRQAADANWTTEGWNLKSLDRTYNFKVALALTDDDTITTSAYDQLVATYATDTELKKIGIPADARATFDAIAESANNIAKLLSAKDLDFTFETGYYNKTGDLQSSYSHVEIVVNPSEIYSFKTRYGSAIYPYLIMDASNNIIDIYNGGYSNDAWNTVKNFVVLMPKNASKLIVQTNNTSSDYVYIRKVVGNKIFDTVKWTCIGDSLTAPITTRASVKYYDYIQEKTGVTFVNLGVSGTGYANDYNGAGTFQSRVSSIPDDTDILTIFGGGNDLNTLPIGTHTDQTTDTVMGCVYLTLQDVFTSKPHVLVGVISPTPWMQYPPYTDGNKMLTFTEELKKLCAMYSVPCLDLYHNSNLRPWEAEFRANYYSKDGGGGTHPDENGNKRFTGQILEFLKSILYA